MGEPDQERLFEVPERGDPDDGAWQTVEIEDGASLLCPHLRW